MRHGRLTREWIIGIDNIGWKYLIMYCCWLTYEIFFVFFFFPETQGLTLEELTFRMFNPSLSTCGLRTMQKISLFQAADVMINYQCSRTRSWPTVPPPLSRRLSTTRICLQDRRAPLPPLSRRRPRGGMHMALSLILPKLC